MAQSLSCTEVLISQEQRWRAALAECTSHRRCYCSVALLDVWQVYNCVVWDEFAVAGLSSFKGRLSSGTNGRLMNHRLRE